MSAKKRVYTAREKLSRIDELEAYLDMKYYKELGDTRRSMLRAAKEEK